MSARLTEQELAEITSRPGGPKLAKNHLSALQVEAAKIKSQLDAAKNAHAARTQRAAKRTQHVESKPRKDYKAELLQQLALAKIPAPEAEVRFHPTRRWRWDWAYPDQKLAIEYQGGVYAQGKQGHQTTAGMERDCLKFSEGAALGWRLIIINAGMVRDGTALNLIERALFGRGQFICIRCGLRQDEAKRTGEPPF